jgi:hypothetical protein
LANRREPDRLEKSLLIGTLRPSSEREKREGRPSKQENVTVDAKFRRSLISAAVAALVGTAALAASAGPEYSTMSISSGDGTSRAWISDNPIYGHAPQDLVGIEVVGSDGGSIGKIKGVVMGSDLQSAHAVISMVESPGTGARDILVAFEDLRVVADKVQVGSLTADAAASHPGYQPKGYSALESSRPISDFSALESSPPISDFSALEPLSREAEPGSLGPATDERRHSGAGEEAARVRSQDASAGTRLADELDTAASVDTPPPPSER